jgi:outer membrane protein
VRKHVLAAAIAALSFSGVAVAHQPGDVILRVGVAHAEPDVSHSKTIKLNGVKHRYEEKLDVESSTQIGLSATYMILPRFGIELMASTPFIHRIKETPHDDDKYTVGKVSRLSPTVSGQFFFLNPKSKFQPYVGLGLNYNLFYNAKLSREMKDEGEAKSLKLKNSIGVAAQVGMDYMFTDRLVLNASIMKMVIPTRMEVKYNTGDKAKLDLDIDPWVFSIGAGYKF